LGTLFASNGQLWYFGNSSKSWLPGAPAWVEHSSYFTPIDHTRGDAAVATLGTKIVLAGGHHQPTTAMTDTVQTYDTTLDVWGTLPNLPIAFTQECAGVVDKKLYVFGGNSARMYVHDTG